MAAGGEREEEEGERWIKPAKGSNEGRGEKATCSHIVQKSVDEKINKVSIRA